jgi:8-oxo-dGTP pyrophosphatase MutT (NUDIX family)
MGHGFRQTGEEVIHQGWIMRLVRGHFEGPDGTPFQRDIVRHPGAVAVVAVDGPEVVLVRQYRPVMDDELLEIPAGTRDRAGEAPEATARRELQEEIGATAASLEHLATYWVAPGVSDEKMDLFLATGLTFGARRLDGIEEQHMTVERINLADAPDFISSGRIVDAKSIVGLLLAATRLTSATAAGGAASDAAAGASGVASGGPSGPVSPGG